MPVSENPRTAFPSPPVRGDFLRNRCLSGAPFGGWQFDSFQFQLVAHDGSFRIRSGYPFSPCAENPNCDPHPCPRAQICELMDRVVRRPWIAKWNQYELLAISLVR